MSVAAVTASIPDRAGLLQECRRSVAAQSMHVEHCVSVASVTELENRNRALDLADQHSPEWYAFIDDDDLWMPQHIEAATEFFDEADIIVSDFTITGRDDWRPVLYPPWDTLLLHNWFGPSVVVARASVFGRWDTPEKDPPVDWIDHFKWRRLYEDGARFVYTNHRTAVIRFGPWGNGSYPWPS